jgi:hypothetical protein
MMIDTTLGTARAGTSQGGMSLGGSTHGGAAEQGIALFGFAAIAHRRPLGGGSCALGLGITA